jgi:hypothetical protein
MEEGGGGRRGGGTRLGRRAWAVQALGLAAAFPRGGWPLVRRLCAASAGGAVVVLVTSFATWFHLQRDLDLHAVSSSFSSVVIVWFHDVVAARGGVSVVGVSAVFACGSALWPWSQLGAAPGPPCVCRCGRVQCRSWLVLIILHCRWWLLAWTVAWPPPPRARAVPFVVAACTRGCPCIIVLAFIHFLLIGCDWF